MASRDYVPLGDNAQVKGVLEQAHKEAAALAKRYVAILNDVLADKVTASPIVDAPSQEGLQLPRGFGER